MSSSRLGSLDHKAAASLPARPHISPLAVRSPSKSDPPLPSLHSPTAVAPLQHDALLGAPPSHQQPHLDTIARMPLGERSRTAEALPAFDTSKEVRPSAQNLGKGVTDPAIELISQLVDGKGGEQQLSNLGKSGDTTGVLQSSGWSSPVHSPRPGSGSRVSPMSTGNSNWAQQSATRPSNPRNPSTSNSSATACQPRSPFNQQQQQQASRTSPPFGYTPFAQYPSYLDAYNTGSAFQQQPVYPYGGGGYGSPEQQLVYPIDSSTYSSAAPFQSPALQPIASPVAGQPYFDSTGYPPFAPPAPYYASAPTSSMSPSLQPSLSSFGGASGKLSSQQTSSGGGGEGADGDAVYGSDGSPATSQEMFALAQSQHYAALQQQASPYVPYVPAPFQSPNLGGFGGGYAQGYSPSFGGGQDYQQQPYQYPISSHQQSQGPPTFSPGQQQASSPYPIPPPPPPPHQPMQPPYPAPYRYFPPAPYGGGYSPVAPFAAAAPSSPLSPPQVYAPPPELARGQLAQSKFHDAVYGGGEGLGGYPRDGRRGSAVSSGGGQGFLGRTLPKPPAHSPHALWVGNVPSDATHPELWRYFSSRSVPAHSPKYANLQPSEIPPGVDVSSTGIESIHLISRSNCAFVNYASDIHLQHSIAVSNGHPLRPHDPRCKDLVCRVRKRDEDAKSGVGAQRTGGMHKDFVREKERERKEGENAADEEGGAPQRYSTGSTTHSVSTTSTTSSFLAKHFEKRYFILKSHDEQDLRLSVDRGLWATQSHNEPVLDQAFHTAKDVFLIFGANRAGAFAGYARMTGPIRQLSTKSTSSGDRHSSTSGSISSPNYSSGIPATIHENEEGGQARSGPPVYPRLFSPSEHRLAETSPQPLTPGGSKLPTTSGAGGGSAPATLSNAARETFEREAERVARSDGAEFSLERLHLPDGAARAESLDPKMLAPRKTDPTAAAREQQAVGASSAEGETDGDGVWRKDQLPSAAERNARLEKMDEGFNGGDKEASKTLSSGWGHPFQVQWIKVARLPFARTRHIKNQFNAGREVKISRDGTELEPSAGEALIAEFERQDIQPGLGNGFGNGAGNGNGNGNSSNGRSDDSTPVQVDGETVPSGLVSGSAEVEA